MCFCLKGFLPVPETSERTFTLCVPACSRARIARTTSHTMWRRNGTPKISSGRFASPTVSAFRFRIGTVRLVEGAVFLVVGIVPLLTPPAVREAFFTILTTVFRAPGTAPRR